MALAAAAAGPCCFTLLWPARPGPAQPSPASGLLSLPLHLLREAVHSLRVTGKKKEVTPMGVEPWICFLPVRKDVL